ncbi:cell division protein FtsK [Haemophilus influenzae]|uniref:DNA translocase FtsK n=1 Tax=Haemophilus influenzae TaxID=727 RepID=A0A0D0IM32_HAEIF|nr:DNA translocase FtsK [Haemophilus influenzae]EDK10667.1 DNA translocase FtsK [Haemophilus influenzae PittHH]KIP34688.1 cell division protein FtsK [Haemophilus influenzae]KIP49544.1 cell division protein FtsK [Haemophilus influenzae]KIS35499.1 DNA translocase FtsK [Haemophilus influenzae]KMZ32312.1 cell division protein FtsK [Haemophilus influenzae]
MAMKVIMARDPLFENVKKYVQQQKVASCSMIQRRFMLGFNRAEQILEQLEQAGIISPMKNGQRKVL